MPSLLKLPFTIARQGASTAFTLAKLPLSLLRGDDGAGETWQPTEESPSPAQRAAASARPQPTETAQTTPSNGSEARFARRAAASAIPSPTPQATTTVTEVAQEQDETTAAEALGATHVSREAEVAYSAGPSDDPGPTITVAEPWSGYGELPAPAIVDRLVAADAATKAAVSLYEASHKGRSTVLKAASA